MAGLSKESPIIKGPQVNSNCVSSFADVPLSTDTSYFFSETFPFLCVLNVILSIYGSVKTSTQVGHKEGL